MMKKKMALFLAGVLSCSILAAGCAGNQAANEYVTVGGYKGIEIDKVADQEEVADEDVEDYIDSIRYQQKEEVADRPVEEGDIANIDFVGKMNGEEFDGGAGEGYDLTIGSGEFIDGFEDSIIGHSTGETFDWNGQFPDPYTGNPDYSGKDVTFTITVNSISALPELSDEFVQKVSEESKTVEEYKKEVRGILEESMEDNYRANLKSAAWDAVIEKAEVEKYPEDELKSMKEETIQYYKDQAEAYGMTYEEFVVQQTGYEIEEFEEKIGEAAEQTLKAKYTAYAIADKENLTPSDDEYEDEYKKLAEYYGFEDVDSLKEAVEEDQLKDMVVEDLVMEWLADHCVQVVSSSAE